MKNEMDRRTFIKHAVKGAAVVSFGVNGPFLGGCRTGQDYDLVVKDGLIFDGLGRSPFRSKK
jgi:N-acyl-D-amino-acid deacylase